MYAVVRIRGEINARQEVRDTLKMLNLPYINNCTIVRDDKNYKGMLQKVKDYVTWGEISKETLQKLLEKRGGLDSKKAEEAAEKISKGEAMLKDFTSRTIRLHPPIKGYRSIKKPYGMGGSLGYRGKDINELIERML
jgi:large subunit ribosomal protein L30